MSTGSGAEGGKVTWRTSTNQLHSLACIFDEVHDDYDHENEATTTKLFTAVCLILSVTGLRAIAGFYIINQPLTRSVLFHWEATLIYCFALSVFCFSAFSFIPHYLFFLLFHIFRWAIELGRNPETK